MLRVWNVKSRAPCLESLLLFLGKSSGFQARVSLVHVMKITFTHQLQHGNEFRDRWTRWRSFALSEHWKPLLFVVPVFADLTENGVSRCDPRGPQEPLKGLSYGTAPQLSDFWQWLRALGHSWCWICFLLGQFSPCPSPIPSPVDLPNGSWQ